MRFATPFTTTLEAHGGVQIVCRCDVLQAAWKKERDRDRVRTIETAESAVDTSETYLRKADVVWLTARFETATTRHCRDSKRPGARAHTNRVFH